MGGGGLKMLSKNAGDGVHLIVKLPAIGLQACKFTKNELLHTYFSRIFKLLFIVLSRNLFLEGGFIVQGGGGVFRCEGFFFRWGGGTPWGSIGFDGVFLNKIIGWGEVPPVPPTMGNPVTISQSEPGL